MSIQAYNKGYCTIFGNIVRIFGCTLCTSIKKTFATIIRLLSNVHAIVSRNKH